MDKKYTIVLEQGKAAKSVFEMSNEEIAEAGKRIFKVASERAAKTGRKAVFKPIQEKAISL